MEKPLDENINESIPEGQVYKDKAFWVGTFLGGPLVAGYFFVENFKVIGQKEKVSKTWFITIIACIVIFGGVFLIPDDVEIPSQLIPISYTALAYGLFKQYQEKEVNEHIAKGGDAVGWGRIILAGIIGLLITIALFFAIVYIV